MWTNCVRTKEAATKICRNAGYTKNDYCQGGTTIKSSASGRCIDVPSGSRDNGVRFQIYDCNNSNAQNFYRDDKDRIVNANSGKCLDVVGGQNANGTAVHQWDCLDSPNQKWDQDSIGRLRPRNAPNKCLDIVNGGTGNGSQLHIWDCYDIPSQKWSVPDNCLGSKCWCEPESKTTTKFGGDYTPCYRDEDAQAVGLSNKRNLAAKWCQDQNVGYTGVSDERDCGDWYSSFKCSRPVWSNTGDRNVGDRSNWDQNGCRDQSFRYARRVDLKGASFNDGTLSMLTTLPTVGQTLFGETVKSRATEDLGVAGQWVVMNTARSECDPDWNEEWKDLGCSNGVKTYTRWVNAKQWSNWDAAAEYMRDKFMRESGGKFNGNQTIISSDVTNEGSARLVRIRVQDDGCGPRWSNGGSDLDESKWNKDGCRDDLGYRYARWVDPNGNSLETAVQRMLSRLPAVGQSFLGKTVTSRTSEGNWIVIYTKDGTCDPDWKDPQWNNEGCKNDGNRGYNRWVDAKSWPAAKWQEAAENVRAKFLAESGGRFNGIMNILSSAVTDRVGGGKNVSLVVEDSTCKPGWLGPWQDRGCETSASGFRRLDRQVDAKSIDWTAAANQMAAPIGVAVNSSDVVTFYANGDYQGASYTKGVGAHAGLDATASSVKVPTGLAAILYDGTFAGSKLVLVGPVDVSFLGDFNDKMRSVEVGTVRAKEVSATGGSYVIVRADFQNCFNYEASQTRERCLAINRAQYKKKCINWPAGWVASNDVVQACQRLKPANSNVEIDNIDVVARWQGDDSSCTPTWVKQGDIQDKGLWDDNGCQADGTRRYAREVNTQDITDIQAAMNYMLNLLPKTGEQLFGRPVRRIATEGRWVVMFVDDNCFTYPGQVSKEACTTVGRRTLAQECQNWPAGWVASNDVVQACQPKKPAGSDVNIYGSQVWAKWQSDDSSCNPTWVKQGSTDDKGLWDDNGCQADGTRRYAREVNTQGVPDTQAAMNYMLNLLPKTGEQLFGRAVKRVATEGRWVVMFVDDNCQPDWGGDWDSGVCLPDKTRKYSRPVDVKAWSDWTAAATYVKDRELNSNGGKFNGNQPIVSSTVNEVAGRRYVVFNVSDSSCEAGWLEDWQDKGCQPNGDRKFSRQVQANSLDWDTAADTLLNNIQIGSQLLNGEVTSKNKVKTPSGIWVEITVRRGDCFNYPGETSKENCTAIGKRNLAKQCQNWPAGWAASNDVVQACQTNKPPGSTVSIPTGSTQVWARWEGLDESCTPTWTRQGDIQDKTLWDDNGCQPDGTHKYSRQVNTQGLANDTSGNYMLGLMPSVLFGHSVTRKAIEGDRIAMFLEEDCFSYDGVLSRETCAAVGRRTVAKECQNWPTGWSTTLNGDLLKNACQAKKPAGSDVNIYGTQVWAKYQVDDETCTPTWADQGPTQDVTLWQDNGCQGDGSKRYSRRVLTQGLPDQQAVDHLLTLIPGIDGTLFGKKVLRRGVDGDRVVMFLEDTSCDPDFRGDWQDDGCQRDKTRKLSRWIDAKSWTDWDRAATTVKDRFLAQSGGKYEGKEIVNALIDVRNAQRWLVIYVRDDSCTPSWLDANWNQEGCQPDGTRRYTRKVDAKAMDWDEAANQLLNDLPTTLLEGPVKNKTREKTGAGIWGVINVDNKTCFNYPGVVNQESCTKVGRRLVNQKCDNWSSSDLSAQTLAACEPNKPPGSTVTVDGLNIVAKWELDDTACTPTWSSPGDDLSQWTDRGCQQDGTRKYTRAVNLNGLSPEIGVGHLLSTLPDTLSGMKIQRKERDGNNAAIYFDSDCFTYATAENLDCLDSGRRQIRSECINWPTGLSATQAVNSCESKKPANSKVTASGNKVYAIWDIEDKTCPVKQQSVISPTEEDSNPTPDAPNVPATPTEPTPEPTPAPTSEPITPILVPTPVPTTPILVPTPAPTPAPTTPILVPTPASSYKNEIVSLIILVVGLVLGIVMFKMFGVVGAVISSVVSTAVSGAAYYVLRE